MVRSSYVVDGRQGREFFSIRLHHWLERRWIDIFLCRWISWSRLIWSPQHWHWWNSWLEISTQWMWMLNIAVVGNDFWLLSLAAMLLQQWISSMSMLRTLYPPAKKYINPSSFQSMVKSYGKELPTLTSIHHIRGSYQEDPRKINVN